jgi:hypothetical protein
MVYQESFLEAITDLELEQLHAESSRLQNSIFHLERSNIALQEYCDDEDCRLAIQENKDTIARQMERVQMIRCEVERRGFLMPCGERIEEEGADTSGNAMAVSGEPAPINGVAVTTHGATVNGSAVVETNGTTQNGREGEGSDREDEGIYL